MLNKLINKTKKTINQIKGHNKKVTTKEKGKNSKNRQTQCLNDLKELEQGTANELAMYMYKKGTLPYFSRNFVQPRLNELVCLGEVKIIGKKYDKITDRKCVIYTIIN